MKKSALVRLRNEGWGMDKEKLIVAASPHIRSSRTTQSIMLDVIIALMPTLVASAVIFGINSLAVIAICVVSCVVFEYLSRHIMKKPQTISDLSAVVTGIILAFNLPSTVPIYVLIIGSFIAIVIVKQLFGGLGQNFANPALTARIVLMLSFTSAVTKYANPVWFKDAVASATPLAFADEVVANGNLLGSISVKDLFLGAHAGCLGETCALTLLIGGAYLVTRHVISPAVPLAYLGSFAVFTLISGNNPIRELLMGGIMLGAIFMATDYATTPINFWGKIIFGIGCGLITFIIRQFSSSYTEGVSFSILLMNILTPYIDNLTRPLPLGVKKHKKGAAKV